MSQPVKILEGVFAVNKPQSSSSAGALRDLQLTFNRSKFFAPWLDKEKQRLEAEWSTQKGRNSGRQRRKLNQLQVKLGHGGTLDPLATGVLIVGVGSGTKTLNSFLACTKTYETVVVFGAATDSYDVVGKTVAKAPFESVTEDKVKKALESFRGNIMQKPPIFSALKVKGKPLYEYARNGEEIPGEILERPVEVTELELLEWIEGGSHEYKQPAEEAETAIKEAAQKILDLPTSSSETKTAEGDANGTDHELKRKREESVDGLITSASPKLKRHKDASEPDLTMAGALPTKTEGDAKEGPTNGGSKNLSDLSGLPIAPGPAVRLRMTVSSGFYVRSLAHDLGKAVGSLGYMAALVRTRQGDFKLSENVMEMSAFEADEEEWAPRLGSLLQRWNERQSSAP